MRRVCLALAFLLLTASPSWAVTAFVREAAAFTGANATPTVSLGVNVTAGSCVVGYVIVFTNGATVTSVTSNFGGSPGTTKNANTVVSGNAKGTLFYFFNTSGGGATVTVNLSGADDSTIYVTEVSGCLTTDPYDGSALNTQTNPGGGANALTSGGISPTWNGDYFHGQVAFGGSDTFTAGTDFTLRHNGTGDATESYVQTNGASHAATFTASSGSGTFQTGVLAIKAADGTPISGGGTTPYIIGGGFFRPGYSN